MTFHVFHDLYEPWLFLYQLKLVCYAKYYFFLCHHLHAHRMTRGLTEHANPALCQRKVVELFRKPFKGKTKECVRQLFTIISVNVKSVSLFRNHMRGEQNYLYHIAFR